VRRGDGRRAVRDEVPRAAAAGLRSARGNRLPDAGDRGGVGHIRAADRARPGEGAVGDQHRPGIRAPLLVRPRMTHTITLIPGDGIGPEVTDAVLRILKASGVAIDWERHLGGLLAFERSGQTLPVELIDSIRRNKVALKGPVTTPIAQGFAS